MDAGSEELLGDRLDPKNFKPNLETKVSQKGRTLYSKRGNNVQSGMLKGQDEYMILNEQGIQDRD